ncbi:putative Mitochondrial protein cyt-4 [Glarea lozoyensis 74030]|uniref:Putative Mitochondrial protein cyt-4 n=1 Tax=Glarea lozoyensis (strain ATCC 74030 / MF5533) TaxID=1104152 RepID=H0EDU2_GLAL7|nr:putative Mitochondrial protein cyt-4 [Glarea lozoyensis 74030]
MSGRWSQRPHFMPKYFVPGFVKPEELKDIIPHLPSSEVSPDVQQKLQIFQQAVPRDIGNNILNAAYLATATQMETIHRVMAHRTKMTYATLEEIAEKSLAGVTAKDANGNFNQTILYALHRRILATDMEFRAQAKGTLRAGGEYEIASLDEVEDVKKVEALYGMIGPYPGDGHPGSEATSQSFPGGTRLFLRFMESWCGLQSFRRGSSLHGIGATLLRAIDRYDDVELDMRTGWTFLQEIGIIPFWETPHAYLLKLPGVGQRLRAEKLAPTEGFIEDQQSSIRKDWGNVPVFCIDDVGAHEIDDGVSVEPTEIDDQYWVHVHVADPASHIEPTSPIAEFAQRFVTNVYFPDRVASMLEPKRVQSQFSMGSGRPCLTFSAKLNAAGEILDYKVSAGRINNVIYVTYNVLEEAGTNTEVLSSDEKDMYIAGNNSLPPSNPSRHLTSFDALATDHKAKLKIIRNLGVLRSSCLRGKGGVNFASNNYDLAIHLDTPTTPAPSALRYKFGKVWKEKPIIEVSKNKGTPKPNSPLSYLMILAGEVCAKWCHERGVPTMYRVTPYNPIKEPASFFRRVVIPSRDVDGNIPLDIAEQYLETIGAAQPSTVPGPHVAVGADMFSKCTSPLRRYGDLLMHWQINAALREEHRLGRPLVGNTDESIFPFSTVQIERLLPRIDTRERLARKASVDAQNSWFCQFFIRAWKFGESELPRSLSFVIRTVNPLSNIAFGKISQFDFPATLRFNESLKYEDVVPGQEVEVEVLDIDMPRGRMILTPKPRGPVVEKAFEYKLAR